MVESIPEMKTRGSITASEDSEMREHSFYSVSGRNLKRWR